MPTAIPEEITFRTWADFRYLLSQTDSIAAEPVALIALHGYASNPHTMLRLTASVAGPGFPIASVQAPFQFFVHTPGGDGGYNWGIPDHATDNIALHQRMVSAVVRDVGGRLRIPAERCVLVGFSQAVGLNYRFIATFPERVGGAIGLCGGVPHDWESGPFADNVQVPALHISRDADEVYPLEKAAAFPARLRRRLADLEFHMLPGGHRFPSKSGPILRDWLARKFGRPRA